MSLLCEVEKTLEDVKSAFIQEIKHLSYLRQRKNKAMEVYHARETIWKIDLDNRSLKTNIFFGRFDLRIFLREPIKILDPFESCDIKQLKNLFTN